MEIMNEFTLYEPIAGSDKSKAVEHCIGQANKTNKAVYLSFNGEIVKIHPQEKLNSIYKKFDKIKTGDFKYGDIVIINKENHKTNRYKGIVLKTIKSIETNQLIFVEVYIKDLECSCMYKAEELIKI